MLRAIAACAPLADPAPSQPRTEPANRLLPAQEAYLVGSASRSARHPTQHPSFTIKYESWSRNPKWVFEHMSSRHGEPVEESRRHMHFYPEPQIHRAAFQTRPDDFKNSGFDRGHMAPAASHKTSVESLRETFTMANVCPQDPGFNRGYWLKVEDWVRRLLQARHNEKSSDTDVDIVVVSGPAYLPSLVSGQWVQIHRVIGSFPRWIHVPTHFFKVVVRATVRRTSAREGVSIEERALDVGAFLLPNKNLDTKIPLEAFAVRLCDLEALVGMSFYDEILSEATKLQLDSVIMKNLNRGMNSIDMDIGHGLLSSNAEIGLFEHSKDASKVASAILDSGHSENAREFELVSSIDKFSNHRSNAKLADSNLPVKRIVGKDYYADIPMLYLSDLLGNRQDVESSLLSSRTKFISKSPFKVRHLCEMGGCSK